MNDWKTLRELIETRGINGKVIVSAELGINHNGDMNLAVQMIEAAADAGCQAVKVQNYRTGDFVKSRGEVIELDGKQYSAWDLFSRCELDFQWLDALSIYAKNCGLIFHSTPTNEQGIRDLKSLQIEVVKIASDIAIYHDFVKYAEATIGKLVISTGCLSLLEIPLMSHDNCVLLHCIRQYPTMWAAANLQRIGEMRLLFGKYVAKPMIGYSDHTEGIECAASAVKDYGACWLECHVTLDHGLPGPDHRWSKDFTQIKELIRCLR